MQIGIYACKNKVNGKIYIGQTNNLEYRIKCHKKSLNNPRIITYFKNALIKYGWVNFEFSLIEECLIENLDEREIYWINFYQSNRPTFGYNLTNGGHGSRGFKQSEATLAKKRAYRGEKHWGFGRKLSEETKKKIGKKSKERYKNGSPWTGKLHFEETKLVMSFKATERLKDPEKHPRIKTVNQLDLSGQFIKSWPSARHAARVLFDNPQRASNISATCLGKQDSAFGFKWQFV